MAQQARAPATEDQLVLTYRVEGRNAIFDSENVTLVFPNLSKRQRNIFNLKGGSLPIQIAGDGISEATVSCRRNFTIARFHSRYENGTNTITFCGRKVMLSDRARVATIDGQTIDLSNAKREVLVVSNEID